MLPAEYLELKIGRKTIGGFIADLVEIELDRCPDSVRFKVFLQHPSGQRSLQAVIAGVYTENADRTSNRLEIRYDPIMVFAGTAIEKQRISIAGTQYELMLFALIYDILWPGGTVSVKYDLNRSYLPSKAVCRDARDILTQLMTEVGFVSIKRSSSADEWTFENAKLEAHK